MLAFSIFILWTVAIFYAFSATVHIINIAGFSGHDWFRAPLKWQFLDVVYLALEILVALGLLLGWRSGIFAFYIAATSQLLLYAIFRKLIIDVPEEFARSPQQAANLSGLAIFHVVSLALVSYAVWVMNLR